MATGLPSLSSPDSMLFLGSVEEWVQAVEDGEIELSTQWRPCRNSTELVDPKRERGKFNETTLRYLDFLVGCLKKQETS